jgi:hypothetical protein
VYVWECPAGYLRLKLLLPSLLQLILNMLEVLLISPVLYSKLPTTLLSIAQVDFMELTSSTDFVQQYLLYNSYMRGRRCI